MLAQIWLHLAKTGYLHVVASDDKHAKFDLFHARHAVNAFVAVVQNEIDGLVVSFQDALRYRIVKFQMVNLTTELGKHPTYQDDSSVGSYDAYRVLREGNEQTVSMKRRCL